MSLNRINKNMIDMSIIDTITNKANTDLNNIDLSKANAVLQQVRYQTVNPFVTCQSK